MEKPKYCIVNILFKAGEFHQIGGVEQYWNMVIAQQPNVEWQVFTQEGTDTHFPRHLKTAQAFYGLRWRHIVSSSIAFFKYVSKENPNKVFLNGSLIELMIFPAIFLLKLLRKDVEIVCWYPNSDIYPSKMKSALNKFILRSLSFLHNRNIFLSKSVEKYWKLKGVALPIPTFISARPIQKKSTWKIGYLGRLSFEKGPDLFCEIATILHKKNPSLEFMVAGHGPMITTLKQDYPFITFLGFVDSVQQYLSNVDLTLVTSRTEGYNLAALDAFSCGVPVLGFAVGGVPEAMGKNRAKFLSKPLNVEEVAVAVENFLESYEENYQDYFKDSSTRSEYERVMQNWLSTFLRGSET